MKCPVCKTECTGNSCCPECGFDQLNLEFLNRADAETWMHAVVWPYREEYWIRMKSEFSIVDRCLVEFNIDRWKLKNPNAIKIIPIIPYGVSEIGRGVFSLFSGTNNIDGVEIPSTVKIIGVLAFDHCKLHEVVLPAGVTEICSSAFSGCRIHKLTLNNGLEIIGKEAFHSTCLPELHIPASVKRIDDGAFYSVNRITLDKNNKYFQVIDGCLYDCEGRLIVNANSSADSIEIRKGTKVIAASAFSWNQRISVLLFPDGVQEIREFAATQCRNLQTVVIPNSVKFIGRSVFVGGNNIKIFCEAPSKPNGWDENWLAYCNAEVIWGNSWHYNESKKPVLN